MKGFYPLHEQAARDALALIERLPPNAKWSSFIADPDDPVTPGTFNIYAPRHEWPILHALLISLESPIDTGDGFETYRYRATIVSFTEEN